MLSLTRGLHVTSTFPAIFICIIGALGEYGDDVVLTVTVLYLLWFILFIVFIWSSLHEVASESELLMFITCLYHSLCIGATMNFFDSLHDDDDDTLFLWMPLAIQIGIFLAVCLQQCAAFLWRQNRTLLRLLLDDDGLRVPIRGNNWPPQYRQHVWQVR